MFSERDLINIIMIPVAVAKPKGILYNTDGCVDLFLFLMTFDLYLDNGRGYVLKTSILNSNLHNH